MSTKGFGQSIRIPADYVSHPKNTDEMMHLKREVETTHGQSLTPASISTPLSSIPKISNFVKTLGENVVMIVRSMIVLLALLREDIKLESFLLLFL